jgi:hypothetical protein
MAIDISIKQLKSILKSEKDIEKFLTSPIKIEEKIDGVKVQVYLKKDAKGKNLDNWIVSYKGNIIYPEETEHNTIEQANNSIGVSEFKFIFELLKNVDSDKLPKGYQYFFEYTLRKMIKPQDLKPYDKLHELILLAYGPSNCKDVIGKLKCDKNDFSFDKKRPLYAKIFGVHTPPVVFDGKLYPLDELLKGLKSQEIKQNIESNKNLFENVPYEEYLNNIIRMFLISNSVFGGLPEGFVVWYNGKPYKFQQELQLDKETRNKISQMYKGNKDEETLYWAQIKSKAYQIIDQIKDISDIRKALKEISKLINKINLPNHSKKSIETIKDDLMVTAKLEIMRRLSPKTGLIIGKIRILTNAHYTLIKNALTENKYVIIALSVARGKDKTFEIRKNFILDCFKEDKDRIEIIGTQNGFIPSILSKAFFGMGVNKIYAGSDRVESYKKQAEAISNSIEVIELKRTKEDISATKVLENIEDYEYFKKNTPKCMWDKYQFIKDNLELFIKK